MEWRSRHPFIQGTKGGVHPKGAKPFKGNGTPTKQLRIALLFISGKTVMSRKDILVMVGESKKNAKRKGLNASIFQTLKTNDIIEYDKVKKVYHSGIRYKEFLQYCSEYMVAQGYHKKSKKVYLEMVKESSQALHFMLED